jgi:hypothetical protein
MEPRWPRACLLGVPIGRATLCLVLLVFTNACTGPGGTSAPSGSASPNVGPPSSTQQKTTAAAPGHDRPHCGFVSPGSPRYGSHIDPTSGQPGDSVEVFGTTFRGEDGRFAPSTLLEVWWNAKVPQDEVSEAMPFDTGPVLLLATVQDMDRCRFRTRFEVPDVRPGTYKIRTFVYDKSGYGWFGYHRFNVEATNS